MLDVLAEVSFRDVRRKRDAQTKHDRDTVSGQASFENRSPYLLEEVDLYIAFSNDGRLVGELTLPCARLGPGETALWPLEGYDFSGKPYDSTAMHWDGVVCELNGEEVDVEDLCFALEVGTDTYATKGGCLGAVLGVLLLLLKS